jgi:hypothetical protein
MKKFWILGFVTVLVACKEPLDKNFQTVQGNYKVGYLTDPSENIFVKHNPDLEMMGVVVNRKIKRLGNNERFAIIERVGNHEDIDATTLDSLTVRYYIIDMTRKLNPDDKEYIFGPVALDEFLKRKKELGINNIEFTKEFAVN